MQLHPLKHVTVITEAILGDQLIAKVQELGASGCTYQTVEGSGSRGVRHGGSPDDENIKVEVICNEAVAEAILTFVSHNYFENYACVAWVGDVNVMRGARYKNPAPQ